MEACRQIANGSKHVETTMHRRAPIVETIASAKGHSSLADVPLFEIQNAEHWVLKIRIAGERRPAKEVFGHVLVFWTSVVGYGLNIHW